MSNLYDQAKSWAFAHPHHGTTSWDGWCLAAMANFNGWSGSYRSAIMAYRASKIVSLDATKAPVGAFHFWDITIYGHIGQDLTGGGRSIFMASNHVTTNWIGYLGTVSAAAYKTRSGAKYLGWALKVGGFSPRSASDLGSVYKPAASHVADPSWKWVKPDAATQKSVQSSLHKRKRYNGPIDGNWGTQSIIGIQLTIEGVGYTGVHDGEPGPQTCYYIQAYARKYGGYKGALDRKLTQAVWTAFARGLAKNV